VWGVRYVQRQRGSDGVLQLPQGFQPGVSLGLEGRMPARCDAGLWEGADDGRLHVGVRSEASRHTQRVGGHEHEHHGGGLQG